MNKRFLGSILVAASLSLVLFAATLLLSGGSTQAGPAISTIDKAQSTVVAAGKGNPNAIAGTWQNITPFPTITVGFPCGYPSPCTPNPSSVSARIKRAAAVEYPLDGKIYLFGGRHGLDGNEDFPLRDIYAYDPVADSWTHKSAQLDGPQTRDRYVANMAAAVLTDTDNVHIYLVGGSNIDSAPGSMVRVYNPPSDSITTLLDDAWPASPSRIPGGWGVYDNKLYIFGGFSDLGTGAVFSDTWRFDPMAPSGSRWTQLGNLNLGRGYMASTVVDGKLYAIGGDTWDPLNKKLDPVSNVERLDLTQPNPTWVTVASLPSPRGDLGAWGYNSGTGFQISGKVMVAGGVYPIPDSNSYLYNPATNSWSSQPAMIQPTRNYAFAQWNGYLYAFGGYDYSNNTPEGANFNQRFDATGPGSTPSPTVTGTPPTATATHTPPSATPTSCTLYAISTGTATIVPGTYDIGNHTDDGTTLVSLDFPFKFYDQSYSSVNLSSNGNAQFTSASGEFDNDCLPSVAIPDHAIFPLWDDQVTTVTGEGIFTSVTGIAPNRIFNIEWRTEYYDGAGNANYELRLYESPPGQFDIIYGAVPEGNISATAGAQRDSTTAQQFFCNGDGPIPSSGLLVRYTLPQCSTGTVTVTPSQPPATVTTVSTATHSPASTATPTPPAQATASMTVSLPSTTPTACAVNFSDVPPGSTFYTYIRCLACLGLVNGYPNSTFKPGNSVTRGQISKIVSNAAGLNDDPTTQMFQDVPIGSTFFKYIGRLASRDYVSGYACGGPGEPCVPPANLQYFRPNSISTRGQLSKIVAKAAGINDPQGKQVFQDVPINNPFYIYINGLAARNVVNGYPCGGPGEPCIPPANLPYFRWFDSPSRGQTSKIAANTFFPNCRPLVR